MKIKKVIICNINSLEGKNEIDFEKNFSRNGVFLITGATGCGKTTIMDAICVSFYHKSPRLSSNLSRAMTNFKKKSFIETFFEINNVNYSAYWQIQKIKNKHNKDVYKTNGVLKEYCGDKKIILSSKILDIEKKIVKLLGLDYNSFVKTIMLPQGSFDLFLKASESQKIDLLEHITGTELYGKISLRVFEKYKKKENELKNLNEKLNIVNVISEKEKKIFLNSILKIDNKILFFDQQIKEINLKLNDLNIFKKIRNKIVNIKKDYIYCCKKIKDNSYKNKIIQKYKEAEKILKEIKIKKQTIYEMQENEALRKEQEKIIFTKQTLLKEITIEKNKLEKKYLEFLEEYKKEKERVKLSIVEGVKIKQNCKIVKDNNKEIILLKKEIDFFKKNINKANFEKTFLIKNSEKENNFLNIHKFDEILIENFENIKINNFELRKVSLKIKKILAKYNRKKEEEKALDKDLLNKKKSIKEDNEKIVILDKDIKDLFKQQKLINFLNLLERKNILEKQIKELADYREKEISYNLILEKIKNMDLKRSVYIHERKKILFNAGLLKDGKKEQDIEVCSLCDLINKNIFQDKEFRSDFGKKFFEIEKIEDINNELNSINILFKIEEEKKFLLEKYLESNKSCKEFDIDVLKKSLQENENKINFYKTRENKIIALNKEKMAISNSKNLLEELIVNKQMLSYKTKIEIHFIKEELDNLNDFFKRKIILINNFLVGIDMKILDYMTEDQLVYLKRRRDTFLAKKNNYKYLKQKLLVEINKIKNLVDKKNILDLSLKKLESENAYLKKEISESNAKNLSFLRGKTVSSFEIDLENSKLYLFNELERLKYEISNISLQCFNAKAIINTLNDEILLKKKKIDKSSFFIKRKLKEFDFKDEEEVAKMCFEKNKIFVMKSDIEKLNKNKIELKALMQDYKKDLNNFKNISSIRKIKIDEIIKKVKDLEIEKIKSIENKKEIELKLENNNRLEKEILNKHEVIELNKKELITLKKLNELIGNKDGTKYRKIVQNLTLEYLLEIANKELKYLTDRYTLLKEDNNFNICVIDSYRMNVVRSVETLSGGEFFLVSLSLALGLIELIGGKNKVDSLFIDEGFGSLDEQTLNTVLDALEKLQIQGKLIGIISHGEILKERISAQLILRKVANGYSKIEIVS